jgi:hypothetical protein
MIDDRVAAPDSSRRVAQFEARIAELFDRLPMLSGFYVTPELDVIELSVHSWPGWVPGREVQDEIREALEDLVFDDGEQAAELLQGRTFARAFH